jgi:hypothetical protein
MMAGDNLEHAVHVLRDVGAFESPLPAEFAVISHWVPSLVLGIPFGRLRAGSTAGASPQIGATCFIVASIGWRCSYAPAREPRHRVVPLVLHRGRRLLVGPASQVLM